MVRTEAHREVGRRYYAKNREKMIAKRRAWVEKNPDNRKAWSNANRDKIAIMQKRWQDKTRAEAIENYGGECVRCGIDDPRLLCFDHVNDDGAQMRRDKVHPRGASFYVWLIKHNCPDTFQLLCWNCNALKAHHREHYDG